MTSASSPGGLFAKSLLITLGVVLSTAAVLGVTVLRRGVEDLGRERLERAEASARGLAGAISGPISGPISGTEVAADLEEVRTAVRHSAADLDLSFAAVLEGDRILASFVRDAEVWRAWREGDDRALDPLVVGRSGAAGGRQVMMAYPDPRDGVAGTPLRPLVLPTLLALVLGILLVMPFVGAWSRRLRALVEAAERMGQGNLTETVWDAGSDEIGVLAGAYEEMRRKVQERDLELRRLNEDLQERVFARTRDLEQAKDVAEEASLAKSMFLANMSHEIRTPMAGILGVADLLYETELDEGQRDYLTTISSSAQNLLRVIDDILDVSRIEAGKLELEEVDFSLHKLVEEVVELLRPHATAKGIGLSAHLSDDLPPRLRQDPSRLRQVLINLAANSVKFTSEGGVVISAEVSSGAGLRSLLRIEVRDSGVGIPAASQAQLFEAFTQADSSTTRLFGGAGLGLAISKGLVDLMHGQIGVESEPGAGSTFWLELPVDTSEEPWSGDTSVVSVPPGLGAALRGIRRRGRSTRILVVEDHPVNRTVALGHLESLGYQATAVTDGEAALRALDAAFDVGEPFELVLMDCQMPGLDGYEACRRLRRREAETGRPRTPVVAVTAHAMTGDRERCLAAGMDDYLAKPFRAAALVDLLETWLPAAGGDDEAGGDDADSGPRDIDVGTGHECETVTEPVETKVCADETPALVDPKAVGSLRSLQQTTGKDLLHRVLETYLRTAPESLDELARALAAGDVETAADQVHSLKGSSASVGAARLAEASRGLESGLRSGALGAEAATGKARDLSVLYDETARELRSILQREAGRDPDVNETAPGVDRT